MEQFNLAEWFKNKKIEVSGEVLEKYIYYSETLFSENKKYNLTGLDSVGEVQEKLFGESLSPIHQLSVPRGTRIADIGTGGGFPGMVLAIFFPELEFSLFDANNKKTMFLEKMKSDLSIENVEVVNGRLEDIGKDKFYRNKFDWCTSRAFGPVYYSMEFGIPFLKESGLLYIYSVLNYNDLKSEEHFHCASLGGSFVKDYALHEKYGLSKEGLLIKKIDSTSDKYPRRFAVVKRESCKIYK